MLANQCKNIYPSQMTRKIHRPVTLSHIIDAYGGVVAMAEKLGGKGVITRQAIQQWESVPPKWVLKVEKHTGYSRHQIRPDIYGPKPVAPEPKPIPKQGKAA